MFVAFVISMVVAFVIAVVVAFVIVVVVALVIVTAMVFFGSAAVVGCLVAFSPSATPADNADEGKGSEHPSFHSSILH
jgi:hypothetical protein